MAEYHFNLKVAQRSKGHAGTVCLAAYHARTKLRDDRSGKTYDFRKRKDLVHAEIVAPDGAQDWVFDRELVWNLAEYAERQWKNGQPGRYANVMLPVELSREAQIQLVREFVRDEFAARGMVADFAIHDGDGTNPHFHLLLTMRELDGDDFARTKQRAWNDRSLLLHWREAWALHVNRALAREGHDARIDHRSYHDRGINLAPQPKLYRNPRDAHLDRRDNVHERLEVREIVREENGGRIFLDPTIPLRLLTSRRSTFTEAELLRVIKRHTLEAQRETVIAMVKASPELVALPEIDPKGGQVYSTKTVIAKEQALLSTAHVLARRRGHRVAERFVEQAFASSPHELTDEQQAAVRYLARSGDLALVQGFAGAGKTTMLRAAAIAWEGQGFTVVGGALMGRAAEQLEQEAGIPSRTLRSWECCWEAGRARLTSKHVLVLDEAAMVGTAQFEALSAAVRKAGAKLVLVGDIGQLQPIEIGAPMRLLQERYQSVRLQKVQRQRVHAWQREATLRFATGRADEGLRLYLLHGRIRAHQHAEDAHRAIVASWARDRQAAPSEDSLMLAFRRRDVQVLNELARAVRKDAGELGAECEVRTERGPRAFAMGERIIFLRNDKGLGVKNGSLGTLEHIERGQFVVRLDATQETIIVDPRTYAALDHGYAATIHKSQGATVDRIYVLASRYMESAATYVSMSRHRVDAELHYSVEEFRDSERMMRALSRSRVHRMAHDVLTPAKPVFADELATLPLARTLLRAKHLERDVDLAVIRELAASREASAEQLLEQFETLRILREDERVVFRKLDRASEALSNFKHDHPRSAAWRLPAYRALEREVAAAEKEYDLVRERLARARAHPELKKRAERLAKVRNARIKEARVRLLQLDHARWLADKQERLFGLARADNVQARALRVRAALEQDAGRALEIVRERVDNGGFRLFELRDREGGPLILTHVSDCAQAPDGRAIVQGRKLGGQPFPSLTHDHDRGHGR